MGQASGREISQTKPKKVCTEDNNKEYEWADGILPLTEVPDDVLAEVLKRVPARDIVKSCVFVCKQWNNVINTQTFWKELCIKDNGYPEKLFHVLVDEDFKKLYFKRPYYTNLIKNPDARDDFDHWKIHHSGGDKWKVELPVGCNPLEEYTGTEQSKGTRCWVTSYSECSKSQTIDLIERGCSEHVLDDLRPDIHVSEWYAARFDCGIEYCIKVELLKNDRTAVKEWTFDDSQPAGREWFKAEHTFTDYDPGVRYIKYYHRGKDTQFWAGWYGAKITLSSVILEPKLNST
ncbi:F-box only protein 44-like [Ruditapes philippinarum]|uniref:F-box only protein 44-like n=1 Tax=Ruditapes philippinarum TaxID=129788 RepID=UPI00295B04D0|nr:F-box only protein 44-like [Ruditapes philippinarum]XP_060592849.1 F-box only protein 44-like [Ruditapes philippinarum]